MTDERFNELLDELIGGLPVTLVVTRLSLAVKYLIECENTMQPYLVGRFEDFVAQYREDDDGA